MCDADIIPVGERNKARCVDGAACSKVVTGEKDRRGRKGILEDGGIEVVIKMGDREGLFEGTVTCHQALPRHIEEPRERSRATSPGAISFIHWFIHPTVVS